MRYTSYVLQEERRANPCTGGDMTTKAEIKVYADRVVYEHTDDDVEYEPIDLTQTALGELLLEAMPPLPAAREAGERLKAWVGKDLGPGED